MQTRDYLFGETDDSCAICGLRGTDILTRHHLDEDSTNDTYENQLVLCHNCHQRFHQSKGLSGEALRERKKHLIQKTLTTSGLNALKIADRNDFGVVAHPFLLYHLVDLGLMTKEERQMGYGQQEDATARFAITAAGRELLCKWFP